MEEVVGILIKTSRDGGILTKTSKVFHRSSTNRRRLTIPRIKVNILETINNRTAEVVEEAAGFKAVGIKAGVAAVIEETTGAKTKEITTKAINRAGVTEVPSKS